MVIRGQTDGVTLREMGEMNVFGATACARAGGLEEDLTPSRN